VHSLNVFFPILNNVVCLVAITVAPLGTLYIKEIYPKESPGKYVI
jgi:hypothetical protein